MANGTPVILDGIAQRMRYLAQRQQVISQNIANSDTPRFKAREVEAPSFASLVPGGGVRISRPSVQITSGMAALGARPPQDTHVLLDRDVSETKPDGNNVTLEDQLLKLGQVQADFAAMTSLYRKQQDLLKTALGKGGS